MMPKKIFLFFFMAFLVTNCQEKEEKKPSHTPVIIKNDEKQIVKQETDIKKLKQKAEEALLYNKQNKFNTDFCILIDMSIHSGVNRFFIWDFRENKITEEYLVGHGCGANSWSSDESAGKAEFSNEDGSHLSSLGKYKIGARGYSNWGINVKYLMHGLEETNSNALKRVIVFHSWDKMSDEEVFPKGSPEGWGCPTVSNNAMKIIDLKLKNSAKPVLMWIYK
ncbi:murein L,D-transpeptidase catalytic domain family protein [Elizabethkingia bruuniana]|uniref:Murein L,D-transpeptidase catalytic domain family protein n=2 Tax=Elizabethkingia bruuniana TaxID=1756149 RepID=A0A7T7UY22_9FLAO|nr:peptidase [Elizabethkingia bruuniana]KGO10968.1 peptidase [Elizabethkingia miricola]KUY28972.1 peptidase [Elizabethkingia bruuniana]OPB70600.1 peptidase [Elizabethkingia bruuniana]QQN58321.1 murein L,D-transpeptidase catalytic domain family protein [Elizabethkingia bruuniana]